MPLNVATTKQALVDLINRMNTKQTLTLAKITISAPTEASAAEAQANPGADTKVKVSAIKGKGYQGDIDVFYNRVTPLETFGFEYYEYVNDDPDLTSDEVIQQVLVKLASEWGLPVDKTGESGVRTYTPVEPPVSTPSGFHVASAVVSLSPSYVLHDSLEIRVYKSKLPLDTVITITRLDGFNPDDVGITG